MITVTLKQGRITRQWRWTAKGANNEVIATSGRETYYNKQDCLDTVSLLFSPSIGVQVRDGDQTRRIR